MGMIERKKAILLNEPHLETVQSGNTSDSAQIAAFRTDMATKLKSLKVYFSPVQSGSGDPSPDNVRPISGHTGLTAKQTGVNMLQCDTFTNGSRNGVTFSGIRNTDGEIESIAMEGTGTASNLFRNLNYNANALKLMDGRIAFNAFSSQANIQPVANVLIEAEDGTTMLMHTSAGWYIYNINQSAYTGAWARIQAFPYNANGVEFDTTVYPMMCLAQDQGCDYEPYTGQEISISWSDLGTKYGGYVDLVGGELVVTHKKVTLGADAFPYVQSNGLYFILAPTDMLVGDAFTDPCSMCDKAVKVLNRSDTPNTTLSVKFGIATRGAIYLYNLNRVAGITTQEAFNSWIVDNPITYIYPLATPQTYQLTPQAIKTLIGRNNIWSDAGNVEVKYWTH